jgi:hypothetical protein
MLLIESVPQANSPEQLTPGNPEVLDPNNYIQLGGSEPRICASIGLSTDDESGLFGAKLVLVDVGTDTASDGASTLYDLDGSGEKRTFNSRYVLVGKSIDYINDGTFFQELEVGTDNIIGRNTELGRGLGLGQNMLISGRHLKIAIDTEDRITIEDIGSTNGSVNRNMRSVVGDADEKSPDFGYTVKLGDDIKRAGKSSSYNPDEQVESWGKGVFGGRPIIRRDTKINGGVYPVGTSKGEAIVVDDKKYPKELDEGYQRVVERITESFAETSRLSIKGLKKIIRRNKPGNHEVVDETDKKLRTVLDEVFDNLRYDIDATDKIEQNLNKVAINLYMSEGVGVCRTQALLASYYIERLINDGHLDGRVSIDRNMAETMDGVVGGHSWSRYTASGGKVYIIDPAQEYAGSLEGAKNKENSWEYRRTEDLINELLSN